MADEQPPTTTKERERRIVRRRPLRHGVVLTMRKGAMGLGPNLAAGGVELSDDGIQLLSKVELKRGDDIEISLTAVGCSKAKTLMADVRWCRPDGEQPVFRVGARFRKRLTYMELCQLA